MTAAAGVPLEVSVVSDVVCPWCFIGLAQLDAALAEWSARPGHVPPQVRWYPFQLNPQMPAAGMPREEYLRTKFGEGGLDAVHERLNGAAARAGVTLALDRIRRQPNTLRPHALIAVAGASGRQHALARALFEAYFQQGRDLSDDTVLREVAAAAGLPDDAIDAALGDDAVAAEVAQMDADIRRQGVGGVPLFVVGRDGVNHAAVSGAQGTAAILQAFERAAAAG